MVAPEAVRPLRRRGWVLLDAPAVPGARADDSARARRRELTTSPNPDARPRRREPRWRAHERSKTLVKLVETAKRVIQEHAETCSESEQVSKPRRGPARTPGSLRDVAERIGEPVTNIVKAEQDVEVVEAHPDLGGPDWKQYDVLEARERQTADSAFSQDTAAATGQSKHPETANVNARGGPGRANFDLVRRRALQAA